MKKIKLIVTALALIIGLPTTALAIAPGYYMDGDLGAAFYTNGAELCYIYNSPGVPYNQYSFQTVYYTPNLPSAGLCEGQSNLKAYTAPTNLEIPAGGCVAGPFNSRLCMQADGNFVLYDRNSKALWATSWLPYRDYNFSGPTEQMSCAQCMAVFQSDGNLVLYRNTLASGAYSQYARPYWATMTNGHLNAMFVVNVSPYSGSSYSGEIDVLDQNGVQLF
jgi:hypothetical protein